MSDLRPDDTDFSEYSALPPDLAALHDRLIGDGARWRRRAPDGVDLANWARTTLAREANAREANARRPRRWFAGGSALREWLLEHSESERIPSPGSKGPRDDMTLTRIRGYIGVAAAVLIVGLFAALLTHNAATRGGAGSTTDTPPTPTGPIGTATPAPQNSQFQQPGQLPVVAQSDPAIVYKIASNTLLRSGDGGKAYTAESLPKTDLDAVDDYSLAVSPLNANALFITASGRKSNQDCMPTQPYPATAMHGGIDASGYVPCSEQYMSVDGGHTWTRPTLPMSGVLGGVNTMRAMQLGAYGVQSYVFQAQGQRLYSALGFSNQGGSLVDSQGVRLVVSDDGGATWRLIDTRLASATQFVCDYAAAPLSQTVYAVTEGSSCGNESYPSMTLWSSADGGQSWTHVRALPTNAESGFFVGAHGELYSFMPQVTVSGHAASTTESFADAVVSLDGGKTFISPPTAGLPAKATLTGPMGTLADGSVVYSASINGATGQGPSALYTWKKGANVWTKISPSAMAGIAAVTVTPPATGATQQTISIIDDDGNVSTAQVALG